MGVSSAQLTILGMPDREKRWIERRSYFIREKAILLRICEVIDYFIVPLDLMNRPQFLYTCGQNIHLSCKNVMSENSGFNMFEFWKTTMYKIRYALLPNHGTQGLHKELELDTTHIIPYIHRRTQNNSKNKKENLWQSSGEKNIYIFKLPCQRIRYN